jgi:acyl-CoA synthetase (AMP-forming)/AMP-acid ligase II
LGYLQDGRLFVTGRKKELIIVSGRNYYPQDIERAVHSLEVVRPGSVVAFGTRNGREEGVVVVAAPRNAQDVDGVGDAVRGVVAEHLNLPVLDVVLMESGRIPRTTSGKLCRGRCRDLYEEGKLS